MSPSPAYILAGGKSSRFGSDKALAPLGGSPLVVRVAEMLRGVSEEVTIVADVAGKYADLGLTTITDRRMNCGPLAGVETALCDRVERFGPGWIVLASCDLAGLKREWVETIARQTAPFSRDRQGARSGTRSLRSRLNGDASEHAKPNAIAFRETYWQPFPAAYHTDLLPIVEELLDAGRASFQQLLSEPKTNAVALPLPSDWPAVVQANTPEELDRFREQA
ncbi:MAG: molybdenum cofactor guanylyltransferase [Planctomycetaceae bacterium]